MNKKYPPLGLLALGHRGIDILHGKTTPSPTIPKNSKRKTLLIGWDAADWKLIDTYRAKGILPTLDKLIKNGTSGKIATLDPPYSPMLWTSIATGKTADKHGILGFIEKEKDSFRPIRSNARSTHAVWNMFTQKQNIESHVINWWPSYPVENIKGSMVANHCFNLRKKKKLEEPIPYGFHPASLFEHLKPHLLGPEDLLPEHIAPFFPDAQQEWLENEVKGLTGFLKIFSKCVSVHAATTWVMENTEWDFLATYQDTIDHACHGYMKFTPPQLPKMPHEKFYLYNYVVEGIYRFHDMMLERMLQIAGPNTDVILVSDHGFESGHLRPTSLPKLDAAPALEHSPFGVVILHGPSFKNGEKITGASVLDITPTLLHLKGLPVGKDMDGKVLFSAFKSNDPIRKIDSWDLVEGFFGDDRPTLKEDGSQDDETLAQLIELGYIDQDNHRLKDLSNKAEIHQLYNLSRVYISKNEYSRAIFILQELLRKDPQDIRFHLGLISAFLALENAEEARKQLQFFYKTVKDKGGANLLLLEVKILEAEKKYPEALHVLEKGVLMYPYNPRLHETLGYTLLQLKKFKRAITCFDKALEINPDNARTLLGKAMVFLRQGNWEECISLSIDAIQLTYNFPKAHQVLGEAFEMANMIEEATQAYETCLLLAPHFHEVRKKLMVLYSGLPHRSERLALHKRLVPTDEPEIVLVSGLPRSGTSMMMQILHAGGIDVLADETRQADENNPKGYFELEKVKRLSQDASWMGEAKDKALKVVAPLLQFLPRNYRYKVVFMKRDINTVIVSQQKMLGKNPENVSLSLYQSYENILEDLALWKKLFPLSEVLEVDYNTIIDNPLPEIQKISAFLGKSLDEKKMMDQVDKRLQRNK